jgi:hypothetical protein
MQVPKQEVLDLGQSGRRKDVRNEDLLSFHAPQTWEEFERAYASVRLIFTLSARHCH